MASKIMSAITITGNNVYCIIRREENGWIMDNVDGAFRSVASDPYITMVEDSLIKGRYILSENRTVWVDGKYTSTAYVRSGVSPSPIADTLIGIGEMWVRSNAEINTSESVSAIDWDRISSPVAITQPTITQQAVLRMVMMRDRTLDLTFDLHRNITADTFYFAMKTDRKNIYYDVEPIQCTIDDPILGLLSLSIPETATQDLAISKYYGELMRVTASGKYQTMSLFEIDLTSEIISTRDII